MMEEPEGDEGLERIFALYEEYVGKNGAWDTEGAVVRTYQSGYYDGIMVIADSLMRIGEDPEKFDVSETTGSLYLRLGKALRDTVELNRESRDLGTAL